MDALAFVSDSGSIISSNLFSLAKKNSKNNYATLMTVKTANFTPNETTVFNG